MITQAMLDEASRKCLAAGVKVLQGYRLADTDEGHIAALLARMAPGPETCWIDIGCGFGEPAALMQEARPDLRFELVNNNEFQLSKVPAHLSAWRADMHQLPFLDQTFDGAMFLYSLCHGALYDALKEAARVVKDGGRLFVFDYLSFGNSTKKLRGLTVEQLGARFWTFEEFLACAELAGWCDRAMFFPSGTDALFRAAFEGDDQLYNQIFSDLVPVIITATVR